MRLKIFESTEFGQVKMVEVEGKPYAVGSDIAKALEYAIPHKAVHATIARGSNLERTTSTVSR